MELLERVIWCNLKSKLYKTVTRPTLIYGSECWALLRAEQQRMHKAAMKMLRWVEGKTRTDRIRNEKFRTAAMVKPITTYLCRPETPFVVWPCNEKRRHECCKASNNDEGGREETSRKTQSEVGGHSAERSETPQARSKALTEPISMEESSHDDRPRTWIRSAKVSKREQT